MAVSSAQQVLFLTPALPSLSEGRSVFVSVLVLGDAAFLQSNRRTNAFCEASAGFNAF